MIESILHLKQKGDNLPAYEDEDNLPEYEENFGNKAEEIVMDILEKRGMIIEAVEKGTKAENIRKKVDFWIKFKGIEIPIGVQYTITDSEDKMEWKLEQLGAKEWTAEKKTSGKIQWTGKTDLILIKGDKKKLKRYYEESIKKNVSPAEIAGDEFIRGFFEQILRQLKEFNPAKANLVINAFQKELANQQQKRGQK